MALLGVFFMIVNEALAGLRLAVGAIGGALAALNGVQLAIILPALLGTAYALVQFVNSLKEVIIQFFANWPVQSFVNNFSSIFDSDLFHLFSYCCNFKFLGFVFNFYYFAFSAFVVLTGTCITLWAATKFWPVISNYIYQQAKKITGG